MMDNEQFERLLQTLISLPNETEWVEFKQNRADPQEIGEYISALSNSAALHCQPSAYILWGVEDTTKRLVGTSFRPHKAKKGNALLELWLATLLEPRIEFEIIEAQIASSAYVMIRIQPATVRPVQFSGIEYIRIGSCKKKLLEFPAKERALWQRFEGIPFEQCSSLENRTQEDVLALLDYPAYFDLMSLPIPLNPQTIIDALLSERIISSSVDGRYSITNVGGILLARDLNNFVRLARKAPRVVSYRGESRVHTLKERIEPKGYAVSFQSFVAYVNDQLPQHERIGQALRGENRAYPQIAIRELVANALIHQDFSITGTGPIIEIFSDRVEITNPGAPLIDPRRFINEAHRSRNEILAAVMRRMKICEERGTGIDKVIDQVEQNRLPAPDFYTDGDNTKVVLFGPRLFDRMDPEERIRACYQHACLLYASGQKMSNATLRKRLGISDTNYSIVSRVIHDSIEKKLVKPSNENQTSRRNATYVPFWA